MIISSVTIVQSEAESGADCTIITLEQGLAALQNQDEQLKAPLRDRVASSIARWLISKPR